MRSRGRRALLGVLVLALIVLGAEVTHPADRTSSAPVLAAQLTADGITLTGTVPSASAKNGAAIKAAGLFGGDLTKVTNRLEVASSADSGTLTHFLAGLGGIAAKPRPLGYSLSGTRVVLTGTAFDAASRLAVERGLSRRLGSGYSIGNRIRIAAPTKSPGTVSTASPPPPPPPAASPAVLQRALDADLAGKTIEFETGSAVLTAQGIAVLRPVLPAIRKSTLALLVDGYTDNVGESAKNRKLSLARARAVGHYLVANGVAAGRLTAEGFGSARPVATNATDAGRQKNRRIVLRVKKG